MQISCVLAVILIAISCRKEDDFDEPHRLFKPQISVDNSVDNQLTVTWLITEGAKNYQVDIAVDSTFAVIDQSATVDAATPSVVFTNLLAATEYFVRVQAIADDPKFNSKYRIAAASTSSIFLNNPNFILDNSFIVKWAVRGLPVSDIVVRLDQPENQYPVVKEFTVDDYDASVGLDTVSGFLGSTSYRVELYSGTLIRGIGYVTTKPSLEGAIDLRDIDPLIIDQVFNDTILKVPDGAIILLKRGWTYHLTAPHPLNQSVQFVSGYSFIPDLATIAVTREFSLADGCNIGSITFTDLNIVGTGSNYLFQGNVPSANVGTITFDRCNIFSFRAGVRLRQGEVVDNLIFNNCLMNGTLDYGYISCRDNVNTLIKNISVTNCTVINARRFIIMTRYPEGVPTTCKVENCTFYTAPWAGNRLIDYSTNDLNLASVTIANCIFGAAGAEPPALPTVAFVFAPAMMVDAGSSNYVTSDFYFTGIESATLYSGNSFQLFRNPAEFDFTIIDNSFAGRTTAGDPRWRQ